jgi:pyruvate ferredoxin oxidoreductase gamma subunit
VFQVRVHGRGGQGVVTAAEMLSTAAFLDGSHAQAFPSFGSERTGAPVISYCRIDTAEIRLREPIIEPDAVVIQDPTLLGQVDVCSGLLPEGHVLINSERDPSRLPLNEQVRALPHGHCVAVPAAELAARHVGRPLPNAALLGGFAALTGTVGLARVAAAIRLTFPGRIGEGNVAAAEQAFRIVRDQLDKDRELSRA